MHLHLNGRWSSTGVATNVTAHSAACSSRDFSSTVTRCAFRVWAQWRDAALKNKVGMFCVSQMCCHLPCVSDVLPLFLCLKCVANVLVPQICWTKYRWT